MSQQPATIDATTVPTKFVTLRLPEELADELEAIVEALDEQTPFGRVTRTEVVVQCLKAHLPVIRAKHLKNENDADQ